MPSRCYFIGALTNEEIPMRRSGTDGSLQARTPPPFSSQRNPVHGHHVVHHREARAVRARAEAEKI